MTNKILRKILDIFRQLDRYVLKSFLAALAIAALSLIGLYVVINFFTSINDFLEITQTNLLVFIIWYYLLRVPSILSGLLPIVTLIAFMLTLARLTKSGELVAMLSSGISIQRIILPVFVVLFIVVGLVYVNNEMLIPYLGKYVTVTDKILKLEGADHFLVREAVRGGAAPNPAGLPAGQTGLDEFIIKKYNYVKQQMSDVWISQYDRNNNLTAQIIAEQGVWSQASGARRQVPGAETQDSKRAMQNADAWLLTNGQMYTYDNDVKRKSVQTFPPEGYLLSSELTPATIAEMADTSAALTLAELKGYIAAQPDNFPLQVQYYSKLTGPLVILLLIFIGLPFAVLGKTQNFFTGVGICLIIGLVFFIVKFLSENLGNKNIIPPFWAVVLPLALFALVGIFLSSRVRT